jgi:two-component system sensor kinase FixL
MLSISPIRNEHGVIIGVSKIARDLSEMQHVYRDLERREALLRAILDTAPDALIVIDKQGIIQSFSAAARLFGLSTSEALGQNVNVLMPAPYRNEHDGYLAHYLSTAERRIIGIGRIVVGQRKDGFFLMELAIGEVSLPGMQLFAGVVRDLTAPQGRERRINELQAELVHVSRVTELGQMVAALAHEVNQPLTAITSYLSGIRRLLAAGNQSAAQQAMEKVIEQGDRARRIQRIRDHVSERGTEKQVESPLGTIEEASALAMVGIHGFKLKIQVDEDARDPQNCSSASSLDDEECGHGRERQVLGRPTRPRA